ncbi:MAG: trypsin-like peptidase domain-containing protein [Candidatus Limnocylindria bacterium]|nr:trypsin-like peptidase domain-containing protein [Candidatus Limnocylindria bacterium]
MTEVPMRHEPAPSRPPARGGATGILLAAILVSAVSGAAAGGAAVSYLAPAAVTVVASPTPAPAATVMPVRNAGGEPVVDLVRDVLPGVVTVISKLPGGQPQSSGSGYVIDAQRGYIVTNSHVVTNVRNNNAGDAFDVIFSDETKVAARLIGRDPQTDVAVLQVPAQGLRALSLGNSDEVPVGAQVVAIGSALGELRNSVTAGIVSAKGRRAQSEVRPDILLEDLIQTDAAISPGNSGGPLIWVATRQVVGMNTLVNREPGAEGLGFSVSANTVKQITDELIKSGVVERGFIGITYQELSAQIAQTLSLPQQTRGVLLTQVLPGSPGAAAGLRTNDVITRVNEQPIDGDHPLATIMVRFRANDRVRVALIRDGKQQTVDVTLGRQP